MSQRVARSAPDHRLRDIRDGVSVIPGCRFVRPGYWLRLSDSADSYRTTPEMNPGLRRGGLISFFKKQCASRPAYPGRA